MYFKNMFFFSSDLIYKEDHTVTEKPCIDFKSPLMFSEAEMNLRGNCCRYTHQNTPGSLQYSRVHSGIPLVPPQ